MKPISTTEMPSLKFEENTENNGGKILAQSSKIGWIHSLSDSPAKFDIVIKDSLGRIKFERKDCGSDDVNQFGELINLPTFLGEELDIKIENVRGAKKIDLFLN